MSRTTFQPMTPPRQRIRTQATAPCIHAERKRKMSEWRRLGQGRKKLHKLKPINLFPTLEREEIGHSLNSRKNDCNTIETLWKPLSFSRGRANSFTALMTDGVGMGFLDSTSTSGSNSEVSKKRRRDNNVSFTPNTDVHQKSSEDILSNTPKRSHVLMNKLSKRSMKSRLQDVLFDPSNDAVVPF